MAAAAQPTRFGPIEMVCALWAGVVATLVIPLSPLLLGALVREGRLSLVGLGQSATAEMLGVALVSFAAGSALPPRGLRAVAIGTGAVLCAADLVTAQLSGGGVVVVRLVCGACEGLLLWLALGLIARSALPGRVTGLYVAAQSCVALAAANLLSGFVLPAYGAKGAYAVLAGLALLTVLASFGMPPDYPPMADSSRPLAPPRRGLLALAAVFTMMAGMVALWVYLGAIAAHIGLAGMTGRAISAAIVCKILGGLAAASVASRVGWAPALIGSSLLGLGALMVLAMPVGAPGLAATVALLGFLWMFVSAFQMPMAIEADPSRRSALLVSGAALLGGAAGPLFASVLVARSGPMGALLAATLAICANLAAVTGLALTRRTRGASLERLVLLSPRQQ